MNIVTVFDTITLLASKSEFFDEIPPENYENFKRLISKVCFETSLTYRSNKFQVIAVSLGVLMAVRKVLDCETLLPNVFKQWLQLDEDNLKDCLNLVLKKAYKVLGRKA
jgi:hypothetical protein